VTAESRKARQERFQESRRLAAYSRLQHDPEKGGRRKRTVRKTDRTVVRDRARPCGRGGRRRVPGARFRMEAEGPGQADEDRQVEQRPSGRGGARVTNGHLFGQRISAPTIFLPGGEWPEDSGAGRARVGAGDLGLAKSHARQRYGGPLGLTGARAGRRRKAEGNREFVRISGYVRRPVGMISSRRVRPAVTPLGLFSVRRRIRAW